MNDQALNNKDVMLPRGLTIAILVISLLPLVLSLFGVDFGFFKLVDGSVVPAVEKSRSLFGILGWSAYGAAIITVFLAFLHYGMTGNVTTPIVGVALFCGGNMDAFQVLTSLGLMGEPNLPAAEFIPFTWMMGRTLMAAVLIIGASMFLISGTVKGKKQKERGLQFVLGTTVVLALLAFGLIFWCSQLTTVPELTLPMALIKNPWELIPLALFIFAGAFVLPVFYKWHPSLFTYSLMVSMVPSIIAQIHMGFFYETLYDTHFNIAMTLRIISYVVPLIGLALDYERTYSKVDAQNREILSGGFMQKQSEEVLLRERDTLNRLMDNVPDIIFIKDISLRYTRINNALAELFGLTFPMEAVGKTEADYAPADFAEESRKLDEELIKTGERSIKNVRKYTAKDGSVKKLSISRVPFKDASGKVIGIIGIGRDITDV